MGKNAAQQLHDYGTSVWYDNITRDILRNGELKKLVSEWGVRGLTSNPTIFEKAVGGSNIYDEQLAALKKQGVGPDAAFEEIEIQDIAEAADVLLPVYEASGGVDGFVSIEVSPLLAAETDATVEEGLKLYKRLARPNIMVKVPGTVQGIPAVRRLLEEGVNVNITLLFSVENYREVALTYLDALRARKKAGKPIDGIRSVASFFVSRVDTAVDAKLDAIAKDPAADPARVEAAKKLRGKFGVANSKLAYKAFRQIFSGPEFADLADTAKVQRPLWASTGTKDPAYRDVVYVEELVGPETVNTMPHQTLAQVIDHANIRGETLLENGAEAESVRQQLLDLGIDLKKILDDLQTEGVKKFTDSFHSLNATLVKKLS